MKKKLRVMTMTLYAVIGIAIAWQARRFVSVLMQPAPLAENTRFFNVRITGNVAHPGIYRVAEGATSFEVLQQAILRPTSDISALDLSHPVAEEDTIYVGTLERPAGLRPDVSPVRLAYFLGDFNVLTADGKSRPKTRGIAVLAGDRVVTGAEAQVELTLSNTSHIDLDDSTELVIDKIETGERRKKRVEFFQKSGTCWYEIAYSTKSEFAKIATPVADIAITGMGANFMIDIKPDRVSVHNTQGHVFIQMRNSRESATLKPGKEATLRDDGTPIEIISLTREYGMKDRFARLMEAKSEDVRRILPFNVLLCGLPHIYYFITVQYDNGTAHVVYLPRQTSVEKYAQGISTLEQAVLYGGPEFAATIIERIMHARINKWATFTSDKVSTIASLLGGIEVNVDPAAASALNVRSGRQALAARQLSTFVTGVGSGIQESHRRQVEVMKSLFTRLQTGNLIISSLMAQQLVAALETDLTSAEILGHYETFRETKSWKFRTYVLPTKQVERKGRTIYEPIERLLKFSSY